MNVVPYEVFIAIKKALINSGDFEYVGNYPYDVKKAIGNVQNTKSTDYAVAIIEDGDESQSDGIFSAAGYNEISYDIAITFIINKNKGTVLKKLHDYETIIKNIMSSKSTYSDFYGKICSEFVSVEKGTLIDMIEAENLIGYAESMSGRRINYRITMQVDQYGSC